MLSRTLVVQREFPIAAKNTSFNQASGAARPNSCSQSGAVSKRLEYSAALGPTGRVELPTAESPSFLLTVRLVSSQIPVIPT